MDPFVEEIAARTRARQDEIRQRCGSSKRPREPLSGRENAAPDEIPKRRCLQPIGDENLAPLRMEAGSPAVPRPRRAELEVKPDTPAIASVKSRLKQLTQREEGGSVFSPFDPESGLSARGGEEEGTKPELHLIGDREFRSRVERFEPGPARRDEAPPPCPQPRPSGLARSIREKLQHPETPSASRACLLRQEREEELLRLRAQPISDNAWLKRGGSDPAPAGAEDCGKVGGADGEEPGDREGAEPPEPTETAATEEGAEPAGDEGEEPESVSQHAPGELDASAVIDGIFAGKFGTPPLPVTPDDGTPPPLPSMPLYSVDAYRSQRKASHNPLRRPAPPATPPAAPGAAPPGNAKERIARLSEEASRLQAAATQTLLALRCCGGSSSFRGSREEAEAERLLLLTTEKRSALLAELSRLRGSRPAPGLDLGPASPAPGPAPEPCRGTASVSALRLPLKEAFVRSSRERAGRPTHYFFILIRHGACDITATPLATAGDALSDNAISFPTSVTLQDVPANFQMDVEVFSLSHGPENTFSGERRSSKSKVTPKKLLNTLTRSGHASTPALPPPPIGRPRTSSFSLVGSYQVTLESAGRTRFPLDKVKLESKVRKLLGDEFQEKVPFLSPLEGSIYLRLECEGLSRTQHQGFLTMFEDVSGFGAWHRRWFSLDRDLLSYWNYPNDKHCKPPEGSVLLRGGQSVQPVARESCARPFTFELTATWSGREDDGRVPEKRWFSADTREERAEWLQKLGQALLDLRTWAGPDPAPGPAPRGDP
ncbi:anillin-like [Megalops cyprinoides]|uniref:anillin-like n=1 Tax=Megalops cyprinoides TaxID=118141 RepID=UPI0018652F4A|nr:anillin-like [Megalops cyprinoides]